MRRTRAQTWRLAALLAALLACAPTGRVAAAGGAARGAAGAAQGSAAGAGWLRYELPAGGEVRVENRRGGVRVEAWAESFVEVAAVAADVSADDAANASANDANGASPVRVEETPRLLSISVAQASRAWSAARSSRAGATPRTSRPANQPRASRTSRNSAGTSSTSAAARSPRADAEAARVDLLLRVPGEARLTVFTDAGAIEVRGQTARLDAQSVAGDVRVELPPRPDADVMARALRGTITVRAGVLDSSPERTLTERFQARSGAGRSVVRLTSVRGHVEIASLAERAETPAARSRTTPGGQPATGGQSSSPTSAQPTPSPARPKLSAPGQASPGGQSPSPSPNVPARPSPDAPLEVDPDEVITVDTHVVTLNLSVVDRRSGRGLAGLAREDFRVFEDGVEQQLTHFESGSAPFDLLLLVDLSGSTAKVTDVIRAACLRFVESVRPRDRVGVVAFAGTHAVVSPLTDDKRLLRARIERMGVPTGDTKLYDALAHALDYVEAQSDKSRRRAVVLLSDGLDSVLPNVQGDGSATAYEDLRRRVQEFDGLLYTVWTDNTYEALSPQDIQPETFDLVYDRMEELAALGGGVFYEVEKLDDLAGVYGRVVSDLGTVYSLSYAPTNKARDGRWRAVRVRLPARPEAIARGRNGYFAR